MRRPRRIEPSDVPAGHRGWLAVALVALVAAAACGDNLGGAGQDAGSQIYTLEVLDPPGESIGVGFHGEAQLRVRYLDPAGDPVTGAPVTFTLVASATEATGGSTVSASEVATEGRGIATVDLVAGAERVNFRVEATAAGADPALFYVAVSEDGFAELGASPAHQGFRAEGEFGRVEIRLYRGAELACADLDIDAPPASVFPLRGLDGFGGTVTYRNVLAGEPFTVVAWGARAEGTTPLAVGCVELAADQVRAGRSLRLPMPVADRAPLLPRLRLTSRFDAAPLAAIVAAAGPDPWAVLDCPLGPAQLLIDCAVDAQAPDGELDCAVAGSSVVADAVAALRGAPDKGGCRPSTIDGGEPALDALLMAAIGRPWPSGAGLDAFLAARRLPLDEFELGSSLEVDSGGAFHHRLDELTAGAGFVEDLVASQRPVVSRVAPVSTDALSGQVTLADHSFTLRYGRFADAAFLALGLAPAGLAAQQRELGSALYDSVSTGETSGCGAFSASICGPIGRPAGCLGAPCAAAAAALDDHLDRWWRVLDAGGFDLTLGGAAAMVEADGDLVVEAIDGAWAADLATQAGQVALTGSMEGDAVGF